MKFGDVSPKTTRNVAGRLDEMLKLHNEVCVPGDVLRLSEHSSKAFKYVTMG
jgi:hypothetical protein